MRVILRWGLVVVVAAHGLIHLLGAAKGLGWAEVAQISAPIGTGMGLAWLAAGLIVLAAAALLAVQAPWWWAAAAGAAVASQGVIATAWADAAAGSAANVLLLVAAVYAYAAHGPPSFRAEYRRRVAATLADLTPAAEIVTEADLATLPTAVAAYVRRSGALGQPRVTSFRARMHGRIRPGPNRPWMSFTAEQINTYGPQPTRVFLMDASMFGLPVDVLHSFVGPQASMRAKVCSLVTVVDAAGPDMAKAETVTLLNDLCLFAPAALVDAPISWQPLDDRRVRAVFTNGAHTVTAELVFNHRAELVDFVSDDRLAATPDGKGFAPQRWSTPVSGYGHIGPYLLATTGEGRWHPDGEPAFTYIELHLDDVTYNPESPAHVPDTAKREPQPVG